MRARTIWFALAAAVGVVAVWMMALAFECCRLPLLN